MSRLTRTLVLLLAQVANAHIALWHASMFGLNYPGQATDKTQNYNTNAMVNPLRGSDNFTVEEWFAHGAKKYPPVKGQFMELVAGSKMTFELGCNRAFTMQRNPADTKPLPEYSCDSEGPLHNMNKFGKPLNASLFGGTALAIAYTSDVDKLQPEDVTIISINGTSPWTREVVYEIPRGLPPCPSGGCLVTWNWIHTALGNEGYGAEIYNTLYRAKVTGDTSKKNYVPKGAVPVKCEDDPSKCVSGPKVPMYLWQKEGNNMEPPIAHKEQNPTYNERYGFVDGAQQDAVIGKDGSPVSPVPTPGSSSGAARSAPPACLSASLSVTAAALALSAMSAMSSLQLYLL